MHQTIYTMDKQKILERKQVIQQLTQDFCTKKLNEEYAGLSTKLLNKLGRKRDVPFVSGKPEIWAAAIIHALGTINFLFDKSNEPYVSIDEINDFFGTNKSTSGQKSKLIRDLLNLNYFDTVFSTKSISGNNPFNDFVLVDGIITPLSMLPTEVQQMVREARADGKDVNLSTK
jgi:hypothetical protein